MQNSSSTENEEKLIELYKGMAKLEREKQKKALYNFLSLLILAVILYLAFNHISSFYQSTSLEPDSTNISKSILGIKIIGAGLGLFCYYIYMTTRQPLVLLLVPLLLFSLNDVATPLAHAFYEINAKQYDDIRLTLKANPQLMPILPNYVNAKCEMTSSNYDKIIALSHNLNSLSSLTDLPVTKKTDEIKKMCALTIFRN